MRLDGNAALALASILGNGDIEKAVMAKFPTETEAMIYAQKVAMLKKGDQIYVRHNGRRMPCIVCGFREEKGHVAVLYYDEDKEISLMTIPYGSIELAE